LTEEPAPPAVAHPEIDYDLSVSTAFSSASVRRIRLTADGIDWTEGAMPRRAALRDIALIRLKAGRVGGKAADRSASCQVDFKDGSYLRFYGSEPLSRDSAHAALYRDFVFALHRRLGPMERATIEFTSGCSPGEYSFSRAVLTAQAAVVLLIAVAGGYSSSNWLFLLAVPLAAGVLWNGLRRLRPDAPRAYDPAQLPDELVGRATATSAPPASGPAPVAAVRGPTAVLPDDTTVVELPSRSAADDGKAH